MLKDFKNETSSITTLNKFIVPCLWFIALAFMTFLILTTKYSEENNQQNRQQSFLERASSTSKGLGLDTATFATRFNSAAINFNSDLKMTSIKFQPGIAQDTFNCPVSKSINIIGILDDYGNLLNITIFGFSDGSLSTNTEISQAVVLSIIALNPELPLKDCYSIAKELALADINSTTATHIIRYGKRYSSTSSDGSNIMVTISYLVK